VDALATLLMVIIFVLLVFILGQGFLSAALSNRDRALEQLNRQVAELGEFLALERTNLARSAGELQAASEQLRAATTERDQLAVRLPQMEAAAATLARRLAVAEDARTAAERSAREAGGALEATGEQLRAAATDRDRLAQRLNLEEGARAAAERGGRETTGALETARQEMATLRRQIAEAIARAAELDRAITTLRAEAEAANRTVQADRATIEARLADLVRLRQETARLDALRLEAERAAQAALARAGAEEQRRRGGEKALAETQGLSEAARAEVALLTRQIQELRAQLANLAGALDTADGRERESDAQLVNIRAQLNSALAGRVEELQRYRSEFFGRLREVLGDRPEVRIVGDRFIFQSEVLFPPASAELSPAGQAQIRQLSRVLLDISARIPGDVPWLLRVDGHADRNPIRSQRFASNWELSAARAIAVANLLMEAGLPANRVAAAAFGEHQPIDGSEAPDALARNRRIELRLTDR